MRKSKYSETQIIGMLTEADAGQKVPEICRKYGLSPATFYKFKSRYGGLDASELKRMR